MAIQHRRGAYADFDPLKMISGEFAVVQQGDENTSDGKAVYLAFGTGNVKRVVFSDELLWLIGNHTASEYHLTVDNAPTENSNNPVTSGGVHAAIAEIEDDISTIRSDVSSQISSISSQISGAGNWENITNKPSTAEGYGIQMDTQPTEGSDNPVTSGGLFLFLTNSDVGGAIQMSKAEYDALPEEDKSDGRVRFVSDNLGNSYIYLNNLQFAGGTTYQKATHEIDGLMSKEDKAKLDSLTSGEGVYY